MWRDSSLAKGCSFEVWRRVGGLVVQIRQGCLWVWFMEKYPKRLGGV